MIHQIEIIEENDYVIKAAINERLYTKNKFLHSATDNFFFILERENADKSPHIICSCGNDNFTLNYGCCSLEATCTNCELEQTVYDG